VSSDATFNKEDDILCNVGGDIGNTLKPLGDLHHVDGFCGPGNIILNELPGRSDYLFVEGINATIGAPNFVAALGVFVREGAKYIGKHCLGGGRHIGKCARNLSGAIIRRPAEHLLGDAAAEVGDSFKVAGNSNHAEHEAKVMCHWRAKGQDAHALRFELYFHVVNLRVASLHLFGSGDIAMYKAACGQR
jgi:hypothetical protein